MAEREENKKGTERLPEKDDVKKCSNKSARKSKKGGKSQDFKRPDRKRNDVAWYTKYPVLSDEATKLGFNHIMGKPYYNALANSRHNGTSYDVHSASVFAVDYIPTPGIITDNTAGYAMQIRRLYLAMKRKYRGLNTYQIADLGTTIFCISEFYRMVAKLERIYGVFNYYNPKNRVIPRQLAVALHVDVDNIYNNLADFRAGINALIVRAQSLCLPDGMDVIKRWFLLESNIFKDSEDQRAAYILFDDGDKFFTYQPTWSSTGGSAVLSTIQNAATVGYAMTYQELLDAANDMLDILLNDDDITLQLGDIISYFTSENGDTKLLTLQTMPEDYVVIPTYNEEIVSQIANSNAVGNYILTQYAPIYSSVTPSNFDIGGNGTLRAFNHHTSAFVFMYQSNANMYFNLTVGDGEDANHVWAAKNSFTPTCKCGNVLLNTWKEKPTPEDIMEMTRLTVEMRDHPINTTIDGSTGTFVQYIVESCGSEVILQYRIISDTVTSATSLTPGTNFGTILWGSGTYVTLFSLLANLSQIDWHPCIYMFASFTGSTYAYLDSVFFDLDNARVLASSDLKLMHDAALMSLFEISSVKAISEHTK